MFEAQVMPVLASPWATVAYPIALALLALVQFWIYQRTKQMNQVTAGKVEAVHTLVNGQKGILLEELATAKEEVAQLKGTPEARAVAQVARKTADDHERAQVEAIAAAKAKGVL